jgi:hypothetical protein
MSTDRNTTRLVRSWLEEGVTALPDRVLDAVLDQVPSTPQRRLFGRLRRFPPMNSPFRYAIAAAAVLVVAVVGYQLLPSNTGTGGQTTPAPSTTPAPTLASSPSLAGAPRLPLASDLEPGRYRVHPDLDVTVEAPAGWATCCENPAGIIYDGGEPFAAAIFFEDFTGVKVHDEPCNWNSGPSSEPVGAQAIAEALAAQSESATSVPEDVTVAGLPGFHIQLVVPDDLDVEEQSDSDYTFLTCDGGLYTFWTTTGGQRYAQGPEQIEDVYIVDVDDRTLAFDLSSFPRITDAEVAAVQAMLESIEIN